MQSPRPFDGSEFVTSNQQAHGSQHIVWPALTTSAVVITPHDHTHEEVPAHIEQGPIHPFQVSISFRIAIRAGVFTSPYAADLHALSWQCNMNVDL